MKKLLFLSCLLLASVAHAGEAVAPADLNPAYLYIGPVGDGGWSYAIDQGRLATDRNFPGVKSFFAESVLDGPESAFVMERFINLNKSKLIIAASYGYGQYVLNVAAKYPDVKFIHPSGTEKVDNVSTIFGRIYQARYLSGLVAGKMTGSNRIGFVAAHPIPEVIRGINAFTLGVRTVNPEAVVKVLWLYSWYDQPLEGKLTRQLIGEGHDVIAMHADTGGVARVCEEA